MTDESSSYALHLFIILFLILLNGFFAMSELAVVSSRKPRLKALIEEGNRGARAALALAENPSRLLSTVQVGITLGGILSGVLWRRVSTTAWSFLRWLCTHNEVQ